MGGDRATAASRPGRDGRKRRRESAGLGRFVPGVRTKKHEFESPTLARVVTETKAGVSRGNRCQGAESLPVDGDVDEGAEATAAHLPRIAGRRWRCLPTREHAREESTRGDGEPRRDSCDFALSLMHRRTSVFSPRRQAIGA